MNCARSQLVIIATTSELFDIAHCPVAGSRCASVCGRPSKTTVSDFGAKVRAGEVVEPRALPLHGVKPL